MPRTSNTRRRWASRYNTNNEPQEEIVWHDQELKHIDETFLKKPTRVPAPAFEAKPDPAHLKDSEWPKLPKAPETEKPISVRPPLTAAVLERMVRERRRDADALSTKLYHQIGFGLPTSTDMWVARLRTAHRNGTLLCTRHEIEEGKQIEQVLRRGKNDMSSANGE